MCVTVIIVGRPVNIGTVPWGLQYCNSQLNTYQRIAAVRSKARRGCESFACSETSVCVNDNTKNKVLPTFHQQSMCNVSTHQELSTRSAMLR